MKPLTLTFENIRSYATFGPIDFTGRSLVGILGDTGAGKSTIIEALCLALYGQGSWQGATIADLMADNAPHMSVDLTFHHDGHQWRVQRTFYANTRPTQALLRNLDTNAAVDNVRGVDAQIEQLLRMRIDAFKSAVVLPQGRFTTLLHASAPDRAKLLKGIFGADMLATVEELTNDRLEALNALLTHAKIERATLPADPAGDAQAGADACDRFTQRAEALDAKATKVRDLIAAASTAADAATDIRGQRTAVVAAHARITDATLAAHLTAAAAVAERLQSARSGLNDADTAARQQITAAEQALKSASEGGMGRSALDAATTTLEAAPGLARRLRAHAGELDAEQKSVNIAADDLTSRAAALPERERKLTAAHEEALADEQTASAATDAAAQLRGSIEDVLAAAHQLHSVQAKHTEAVATLAEIDAELKPAKVAAGRLAAELKDTEVHLAAVQRTDAAAAASADLHPSDSCPVCARELPADWHAPGDPDGELDTARRKVTEATGKAQEAAATVRLLNGRREVTAALVDGTQLALRTPDEELRKKLAKLPDHVCFTILTGLDAFAITERVHATSMRAADPSQDVAWVRTTAAELAADAVSLAGTLRESAAVKRAEVTNGRAEYAADERAVTNDGATLGQRHAAFKASRERWTSDLDQLLTSLRSLPEPARAKLPDIIGTDVPDWTSDIAGPLADALSVIAAASEQLTAHEDRLRAARATLTTVSSGREELAAKLDEQVTRPTRAVHRALERALTSLPASGLTVELPPSPDDDADPRAAGAYVYAAAMALSGAAEKIAAAVRKADTRASTALAKAAAAWRKLLAETRTTDDGTAPTDDGDGADELVLAADALTPVTDAIAVARAHADDAAARTETARAAIDRVAKLDYAIGAGQLRADSLTALRTALRPSKFPAHLVSRRTTALLGVASDLFGQLSGDEFGFSGDFQIVARRTGSVRDPKTLSGGETFQAALALALSLVELYSRSAGRLGALFLDEGFGSLDSEALASALDALSSETGGDKLVAVISHLHAVAEAVTDVLWVSKQGSSHARWLEPSEIDALVNADVAAGLLASG